jgi:hypothetical protein
MMMIIGIVVEEVSASNVGNHGREEKRRVPLGTRASMMW